MTRSITRPHTRLTATKPLADRCAIPAERRGPRLDRIPEDRLPCAPAGYHSTLLQP